jgi:glutathione S-transferase
MFKDPVTLYGSSISYFTGKMENYFKIKGISYKRVVSPYPFFEKKMKKMVGIHQMPAVVLPDGRWMTDTTMMIQWFESEFQESSIIPNNPIKAFICYLIEDWADEWWWRPAMHYRWHYKEGADFASDHLARELLGSFPAPHFLKKKLLTRRQRNGYTVGDGVSEKNIASIEANVKNLFRNLENIFSKRTFIFGDHPSLADIGLSGPFFRHFALDPVPLRIMKNEAPAILNWLQSLWNTKLPNDQFSYLDNIPDDLNPLLNDIGKIYLPYLCANVDAVSKNKKLFEFQSDEMHFVDARYSQYRVWCLKQLQEKYDQANEDQKEDIKVMLTKHGCWDPLWKYQDLPMKSSQEEKLPFWGERKMIGVNE